MSGTGLVMFWVVGAPLALTACVVAVIFVVEAMTNEARDLRHLHKERRRTIRLLRIDYPHNMGRHEANLHDLDQRITDATRKGSSDA